eukprot:SAG11_NODE_7669_length_1112_cov_1.814413_1_plen_40_part_10
MKQATGCDAVNIVQNNGAEAGQEVLLQHRVEAGGQAGGRA